MSGPTIGSKAVNNAVVPSPDGTECDYDTGGTSQACNACWTWYQNGQASFWNGQGGATYDGNASCGQDETGATVTTCPGMTRDDAFGEFCRGWCSKNPEACTQNNATYCAYTNAADQREGSNDQNMTFNECRCQAGASWADGGAQGNVWNEQGNVQTWGDVTTQIGSYNLPGEALCYAKVCLPSNAKTILADYKSVTDSTTCPQTSFTCEINMKNVKIQIKDVVSGDVNIVKDKCGDASGSNKGGATSGTTGKPSTWTTTKKYLPIAGAVLLLLLVTAAFVAYRKYSAWQLHRELQELSEAKAYAVGARSRPR